MRERRDELDALAEDGYQDSAVEPEQLAFAEAMAAEHERKRQELWRQLLQTYEFRQLFYDVILAECGYLRDLRNTEDVALHNLATRWLREYVMRNREQYLQMLKEASKREREVLEQVAIRRREWVARRAEEGRAV